MSLRRDAFGRFVRMLRKLNRMSMGDLGRAMNTGPAWVSGIERGEALPPDRVGVDAMCDALAIHSTGRAVMHEYAETVRNAYNGIVPEPGS